MSLELISAFAVICNSCDAEIFQSVNRREAEQRGAIYEVGQFSHMCSSCQLTSSFNLPRDIPL